MAEVTWQPGEITVDGWDLRSIIEWDGTKWNKVATCMTGYNNDDARRDINRAKLFAASPNMIDELKVTHDFILALYNSINNQTFNKTTAQQMMRDRMVKMLDVINKATTETAKL